MTEAETYIIRWIEHFDLIVEEVENVNDNFDPLLATADFLTFWAAFYDELANQSGWTNMPYVDGMSLALNIPINVVEFTEWDLDTDRTLWNASISSLGVTPLY